MLGNKAIVFTLPYFGSIQEKEYSRTDKYNTQYTIEPAGLLSAYIAYDKLCVLGCEKPVPVEKCRQQRDDTGNNKDALYDVLAHWELKIRN